jgi:polyribonucleotide 5'-hydroxyl-kinase
MAVDGGDPIKDDGGEGSPAPLSPLPPSLGVYLVEDPDDTASRVACVNTHAQLEALRDEALAAAAAAASASSSSAVAASQGPRVLVAGSASSGKTSLVQTLLNYAAKLGRAPLWVDLDPDGSIGVPGALCAAAASRDALLLHSSLPQLVSGGGGCPGGSSSSSSSSSLSPLCLWHGSTNPESNPDLFRAQASSLAAKVGARLSAPENAWERSSGIVVDAPSYYAADENYPDLLRAVRDFGVTVVLLTGHDKLYARLRSDLDPGSVVVVKLPRSGGAEGRDPRLARAVRSRAIRRYFYGDASPGEAAAAPAAAGGPSPAPALATAGGRGKPRGGGGGAHQPPPPQERPPSHPALTPFLVQLRFDQIRLYRVTTMSLSSSLLPLGAQQTTDVLQLQSVPVTEQITHRLLGVCHPRSVSEFDQTGSASRLYGSGVAGFVVVERVLMESETVHLLAPCAGALPSHVLLVGDITWMD